MRFRVTGTVIVGGGPKSATRPGIGSFSPGTISPALQDGTSLQALLLDAAASTSWSEGSEGMESMDELFERAWDSPALVAVPSNEVSSGSSSFSASCELPQDSGVHSWNGSITTASSTQSDAGGEATAASKPQAASSFGKTASLRSACGEAMASAAAAMVAPFFLSFRALLLREGDWDEPRTPRAARICSSPASSDLLSDCGMSKDTSSCSCCLCCWYASSSANSISCSTRLRKSCQELGVTSNRSAHCERRNAGLPSASNPPSSSSMRSKKLSRSTNMSFVMKAVGSFTPARSNSKASNNKAIDACPRSVRSKIPHW
mmetsp:Transcript_4495/g.8162  ORF Transcript_4495/g.8162 Transcript_4495/m.8162 type:complete len:318 (-) Transcript_4495:291-1244(-)